MLKDTADALLKYQDASGMFYQVIDRPQDEGNYLETSGTALIAYALLKGVRLGYLPKRYGEAGEKAFQGIVDKYLKVNEDGTIQLGGICLVAGLGGEDRRDGTPAYYYSEPVVENEAKGTAPFILAYTEIARRQK
jgi:unsaturated rhamnogalacturonyl hydrolase